MERGVIFSIAAVFIAQQLSHLTSLTFLLGGLVFLAIVLLLPRLKGMTFWLTAIFAVAGVVLLSARSAEARVWFDAAGVNVTIVTLFLFAPLFGIPVRLPAYVDALKRFYEAKFSSPAALVAGTQLLTQILCVFINVGSIPVVYEMVFVKPRPGLNRVLANAMNRGFAGAILWSPYFAAMTLVTSTLRVPWSSVLPHMLVLAVISLIVGLAVDYRELRRVRGTGAPSSAPGEARLATTITEGSAAFPMGLGMYLIGAMIVILTMENTIDLPMVLLICMAAIFFPLIWCAAKGKLSFYRRGIRHHATVTLPALQKEIALFLAAGFFSGSIGASSIGESVPELLSAIPLPVAMTFSILTLALIVGTSALGVHPIVLVTILAGGIDPLGVEMSPVSLAVLLLGSWALSNPVSPASAVNNLLAGLLKKTVFETAAPNYKFAGCMGIVFLVYLTSVVISYES
ncbi:hypothetical protein COHCIP112018_00836 [Cohnella sp. JJ-181]|nr:hypothetical protein COHCIP112018_00836 [Cohnella sp. JJ-181]